MTRSNSLGNSTDRLGEGKILPLVFKLTIPAVIAQLITFLYNVVDRMFVAKIDGAGMDALAALGIVLPITLIIQAFAGLIGLGAAPRASIKLGDKSAHILFCKTAVYCVRLSSKRVGVCNFIPQNLFFRHAVRIVCTGAQPIYHRTGRVDDRNVFDTYRRDNKHCP